MNVHPLAVCALAAGQLLTTLISVRYILRCRDLRENVAALERAVRWLTLVCRGTPAGEPALHLASRVVHYLETNPATSRAVSVRRSGRQEPEVTE